MLTVKTSLTADCLSETHSWEQTLKYICYVSCREKRGDQSRIRLVNADYLNNIAVADLTPDTL